MAKIEKVNIEDTNFLLIFIFSVTAEVAKLGEVLVPGNFYSQV